MTHVLEVLDPPDGTTRFVDQVVSQLPPDVTVDWFTWRRAFTTRYDVLHVHWPERLLRGDSRASTWAQRAAVLALLARLRVTRTALVRTEHNLQPHEAGGGVERRLLRLLDARTTVRIRLTDAGVQGAPASTAPSVLVPHGDYRQVFARYPQSQPVPGRVLWFGVIREYKGLERLIEVFGEISDPEVSLRIVGRPSGSVWRELVERAAADDPRVSAELRFVPDELLVAEVTAAELVVLPYLEMHNSGAVLVALSLDRPVLVPRSPANELLSDEVGPGWVTMYEGVLTGEILSRALAGARLVLGGRPELRGRDWGAVGMRHAETYGVAVELARAHRTFGRRVFGASRRRG